MLIKSSGYGPARPTMTLSENSHTTDNMISRRKVPMTKVTSWAGRLLIVFAAVFLTFSVPVHAQNATPGAPPAATEAAPAAPGAPGAPGAAATAAPAAAATAA